MNELYDEEEPFEVFHLTDNGRGRGERRGIGSHGASRRGIHHSSRRGNHDSSRRGRYDGSRRGNHDDSRRGSSSSSRYRADMPSSGPSFVVSEDRKEVRFGRRLDKDESLLRNFKKNLRCIGGYSEDDKADFVNDKSYMPFFNTEFLPDNNEKKKKVHLDLNENREDWEEFTRSSLKGLTNFMSWIISNKDESSREMYRNESKFICLRNVLSTIILIPNTYFQEAKFYAISLNGNIYMTKNFKEESFQSDALSFWGHKFESVLTFCEKEGVKQNCGYRTVLTSNLGPHKLYYSGSIDAVNPDFYDEVMDDLSACINFKVSLHGNPEKKNVERYKMTRWCVGMALTNIPVTLVGYRDYNGIVKDLHLYSERDLMEIGKEFWDLDCLFTFTERVLSFVKEVTKAKEGTIFEFHKREASNIIKATEASEDQDFPPQWFLEEFSCKG